MMKASFLVFTVEQQELVLVSLRVGAPVMQRKIVRLQHAPPSASIPPSSSSRWNLVSESRLDGVTLMRASAMATKVGAEMIDEGAEDQVQMATVNKSCPVRATGLLSQATPPGPIPEEDMFDLVNLEILKKNLPIIPMNNSE